MTSPLPTAPDSYSYSRKDASSGSPLDRRTTSSTFGSANRYSIASSETGESSRAVSKRNSLAIGDAAERHDEGLDVGKQVKDGRGSHRSHRSKNSGGFLLSSSTFEAPTASASGTGAVDGTMRQRHAAQDQKGKTALAPPERKHRKRRSGLGLGVGGSPLAGNVTTATGNGTVDGVESQDHQPAKATATGLDVDSAQIVNLALNLSESRRNASRRVISTPLPPITSEAFTGGSLRHHLQQQRRVSRNVSPKPDRGDRSMLASPRLSSGRIQSPLQASFEQDVQYQYHFSASTLARAEKAKNAIELMAQYRRLLQYVPPLKPQSMERVSTAYLAGAASGSPNASASNSVKHTSSRTPSNYTPGRAYNPLQYIRNRKVRARNSRVIDSEAQGFGDIDKVSSWVDAVSEQALLDYHPGDGLMLPPFVKAAGDGHSLFDSPPSSSGKPAASKVKRPRVDWMTTPADMIADVVWLEDDDNKKLIEDHHGKHIFLGQSDLSRPISRRSMEPTPKKSPGHAAKAEDLGIDLRLDTKLPEFKPVKHDSERFPDLATSKARKKFREVRAAARLHHGHSGSLRDGHRFRGHSRSDDSDTDDSEFAPRRRRQSGTADSPDGGKDILEKQMQEMLAREAEEDSWRGRDAKGRRVSIVAPQDGNDKSENISGHSRSASLISKQKRESLLATSSGRASLEVPGTNPRGSFELNHTAPNSPSMKSSKPRDFIPSINMDLSSGRRTRSTSRTPLSKVKHVIRPLYERHNDYNRAGDEPVLSIEDPATPEHRRRSISPAKKIISRTTDESTKSNRSIRKDKGEESGIRGLFKRNPVSRVGDMFWRKDASPCQGSNSGLSTDESDIEDIILPIKAEKASRDSSIGRPLEEIDEARDHHGVPPLPTFTSPFERRGRPIRSESEISSMDPSRRLPTREERRKFETRQNDPTPRIDVHNASPTSSADTVPHDNYDRDDSISDVESRSGSIGVRRADERLNSILGMPGKRRNALPVTGLSALETSSARRPSFDRQWSISDRSPSTHRGPMNKREIARVRALLLSSGIKANEISRRAAELKDLRTDTSSPYANIADLAHEELSPVPKSQQHRLAARLIADDIQLSSQLFSTHASAFTSSTIPSLLSRIGALQSQLVDNLTPMTRTAADEADEVSKDLVTAQMLRVKRIGDTIDKMSRKRRRRFRWARRGGWVLVEWALVGVMWYVWALVVLCRVVLGLGRGVVGVGRWLLWL